MKLDRNSRLCSKDVQRRVNRILDMIDSVSLRHILRHNFIEYNRVNEAVKLAQELTTGRTNQFQWSGRDRSC